MVKTNRKSNREMEVGMIPGTTSTLSSISLVRHGRCLQHITLRILIFVDTKINNLFTHFTLIITIHWF